MPDLVQTIAEAWGWTGLKPRSVVETNAFGNAIIVDDAGQYWRICPEELSCNCIARDEENYRRLRADLDFTRDWDMERLRVAAQNKLGSLLEGRCYCLKIPAVLGGKYAEANVGTISIAELLSVSGNLALQIKDLPDGSKAQLKIVD